LKETIGEGHKEKERYKDMVRGAVITIEDKNFNEITNSNKLVLVDFWAVWCGPCRILSPVIESLAEEYEGRVTVGKLNIDLHPHSASRYEVAAIPTLMLFKDGVVVEEVAGLVGKEHLAAMIDKHL